MFKSYLDLISCPRIIRGLIKTMFPNVQPQLFLAIFLFSIYLPGQSSNNELKYFLKSSTLRCLRAWHLCMQPKCTYDLETQADTDAIYLLERQTVSPVSEF